MLVCVVWPYGYIRDGNGEWKKNGEKNKEGEIESKRVQLGDSEMRKEPSKHATEEKEKELLIS